MTTAVSPNDILKALSKRPKNHQQKRSSNPRKAKDALHARVAKQLIGLPKPEAEVMFHPERKWRLDYAWPNKKVALEVHGATHSGGRHTRGTGYAADREKMNEAQLLGWIVIEVTTDNIGLLRDWIERAFLVSARKY